MNENIVINTPEQIVGIRKSCKLAAKCLRWIEDKVVLGVSTAYLNKILHEFILDHKAIPATLNYQNFLASCCISLNEVICHGIPSEKNILKEGDILNIDVTTILDGFYGDCSTMYTIPPISEQAKYLLKVAKKCLEIGIKQVRPGNYFGNIGYEISKYMIFQQANIVEKYGGHSAGYNLFHGPPFIAHIAEKDSGSIMKENMVFCIEPMINLGSPDVILDENDGWTARTADGSLSAQYEHQILVIPGGYEILTICDD